jgi:uncharacterized membrane protein
MAAIKTKLISLVLHILMAAIKIKPNQEHSFLCHYGKMEERCGAIFVSSLNSLIIFGFCLIFTLSFNINNKEIKKSSTH